MLTASARSGYQGSSYLHKQEIFRCHHMLENDGRAQDALLVQRKLLLLVASQDGEGERGPVVKRVFICHHQLQNACSYWFVFLCIRKVHVFYKNP